MTTPPILIALRLLARFWLEELTPKDLDLIAALPELAEALPKYDETTLTNLAVEYQRLFGFNLPPYESIFIDPSAMLQAPATERVQALYRQAGWTPPNMRIGAPDHLGLELLALADWSEAGQISLARRLHTEHLALWLPPFVAALRHLAPPPFYATLAELTLDLLLATLPDVSPTLPADPFPDLPPPPVYRGSDEPPAEAGADPETDTLGLRRLLTRLLVPVEAGLYLSREEIARISQGLDLPVALGERYRMLETLFRAAGQYELVPALIEQLTQRFAETEVAYQQWAAAYPFWQPYATAWGERLQQTKALLGGAL